jgi:hypothetical protein
MSILLPLIAEPVSSAVYVCPLILTLVPNGIILVSTAIVRPAFGIVPLAVAPPAHFPQHLEQLQYAVSLNVPRLLDFDLLLVFFVVVVSPFVEDTLVKDAFVVAFSAALVVMTFVVVTGFVVVVLVVAGLVVGLVVTILVVDSVVVCVVVDSTFVSLSAFILSIPAFAPIIITIQTIATQTTTISGLFLIFINSSFQYNFIYYIIFIFKGDFTRPFPFFI